MFLSKKMSKPSAIYGLIVLELIIAILGLASGFGLLSDPSGKQWGWTLLRIRYRSRT
jgi:hypothetical protein